MSRETFQILAEFLDKYGAEVEGRELQDQPPEATRARLQQLARGALPATERTELFRELHQHPQWLAWLAQEVKAMRGTERSG